MRIFISHADKDVELAGRVARALRKAGLSVWNRADEVYPGENPAAETGRALASSDAMLVLWTVNSAESQSLEREIQFAIGSLSYRDRLFTLMVGEDLAAFEGAPWILSQLPHRRIASLDGGLNDLVGDIQALAQPSM